ncbi:DUF6064 family protein [Ramlibacter tataouinensis]|uniref:DUF6064 family protein n=1 Tax=Ramlibacter tataouinensis TaxID=94132 RepID=UPI0022F4039B|nr:DUF6064 family protein [Ramlibacter tataouinensis]WBY02536.1 DUF6064 family protein [Ramlibacter tataouinensis]
MSEWWSYRPSDFLMFSAATWGRLLEAHNRQAWPLQWALLASGLLLLWRTAQHPRGTARWAGLVLAAAWAWVALSFHWQRFADVNTAGPWLAGAWALQAALLLVLGTRGDPAPVPAWQAGIGGGSALAALVAYPLAAPLTGRGWAQAEVAGLMPEPTALFTAGLLLALPLRHRAVLMVVPLLSLALGWTTAWLLWTG